MSDREWIAQVTHDKWAVSDSLRSLMINERMSDLLKNFGLKQSKILFFSMFYIGFIIKKMQRFAHSLIFGEQCEQIAQGAHQKWAMWANCSGGSSKMSDHEWFAQVAHKKWANERIARFFERFAQKTDEWIPSSGFYEDNEYCIFKLVNVLFKENIF